MADINIAGGRVCRMTMQRNFFLVDWRNPAGWTGGAKDRPCSRASISTAWSSYPFNYPGVECFPGIQPTVLLWTSDHTPRGVAGEYLYDFATALIAANPEYIKLNGQYFTVWVNSVSNPTYGIFAIDIRDPAVRAIWISNLISHFGSWCKGIHNDYFTTLQFLEGDQSAYGFINPKFSAVGMPEYDPDIWNEWNQGYIDYTNEIRAAWPGVILMGQQYKETVLTPYVDGMFLEENLYQWPPYYPARKPEVIEWLNRTGQGQDTLVDVMWPNNVSLLTQNDTFDVARDVGGYVGWGRDASSGLGGTGSGGQLFRYLNGTISLTEPDAVPELFGEVNLGLLAANGSSTMELVKYGDAYIPEEA